MNSNAIIALETTVQMHCNHEQRKAHMVVIEAMIQGTSPHANAARSVLFEAIHSDMSHTQVKAACNLALSILAKADIVSFKAEPTYYEPPF